MEKVATYEKRLGQSEQERSAMNSLLKQETFLRISQEKVKFFKKVTEAVAQRCSVRKGVLRNFAKFRGKHMWQGLFFNKVAGLRLCRANIPII